MVWTCAIVPNLSFKKGRTHIAAWLAATRSGPGWFEFERRFTAICRLLADNKIIARLRCPQDESTRDHTCMGARRSTTFQMRTGAAAVRAIAVLATSVEWRIRQARCRKVDATAAQCSRKYWSCGTTMRLASLVNVHAQHDEAAIRI